MGPRVRQKLPTQIREVDSLLMKMKGPALKQKRPGSWLPPGPKTERLKKSRSRSALRRPKEKRQRLPTCFRLRSCDVSDHPGVGSASRAPCLLCRCSGPGAVVSALERQTEAACAADQGQEGPREVVGPSPYQVHPAEGFQSFLLPHPVL